MARADCFTIIEIESDAFGETAIIDNSVAATAISEGAFTDTTGITVKKLCRDMFLSADEIGTFLESDEIDDYLEA